MSVQDIVREPFLIETLLKPLIREGSYLHTLMLLGIFLSLALCYWRRTRCVIYLYPILNIYIGFSYIIALTWHNSVYTFHKSTPMIFCISSLIHIGVFRKKKQNIVIAISLIPLLIGHYFWISKQDYLEDYQNSTRLIHIENCKKHKVIPLHYARGGIDRFNNGEFELNIRLCGNTYSMVEGPNTNTHTETTHSNSYLYEFGYVSIIEHGFLLSHAETRFRNQEINLVEAQNSGCDYIALGKYINFCVNKSP